MEWIQVDEWWQAKQPEFWQLLQQSVNNFMVEDDLTVMMKFIEIIKKEELARNEDQGGNKFFYVCAHIDYSIFVFYEVL